MRSGCSSSACWPTCGSTWPARCSSPRCSPPLVAAFVSHRRGIYYALLTIAFGQVFWFVSIKWHSVTGGEDGLLNIRRPIAQLGPWAFDLRSNEALFYFCFAVFALALVGLWRLVHSPFGRVLSAIRQNEVRAAFVGYNVWLYKWLAFTSGVGDRRPGRRAVRDGAAVGVSERDEPALVRLRRDDGADRRRAGQLLGAGDRRGVLHPRPRPARRVHRDLAALVRPAVHGDGAVQAGGHRRALAVGAPPAVGAQGGAPALPQEGVAHGPVRSDRPAQALRRPRRAAGRQPRVRGRPAVRDHGPERRRQDDLLPRADRAATRPIAAACALPARTSPACRRGASRRRASRARSRS